MSLAIKSFMVSGAIMLCLDALWLSSMAGVYKRFIGEHLAEPFLVAPAALFYVLYVCGIVVFAVLPSLSNGGWATAAAKGAFLGLFAYGTYDLTNQATLKFWPWRLTVIDMTWGTVLTAVTAGLAVLVVSHFTAAPN
jgi:uncharacterized membrane protein